MLQRPYSWVPVFVLVPYFHTAIRSQSTAYTNYGLNSLLSSAMMPYTHNYSGALIQNVEVEGGKLCFDVRKQIEDEWKFSLKFNINQSTSHILLRVPESVKAYINYLDLSRQFASGGQQDSDDFIQFIVSSASGEAEIPCNKTGSTDGKQFAFFCHYVTTRVMELRASSMSRKFSRFRGVYCLQIFYASMTEYPVSSRCQNSSNTKLSMYNATTRYLKVDLDKDNLVYGVAINFEYERAVADMLPHMKVVVNGTYSQTDGRKCGDGALGMWHQDKRLLYPCGYAGKYLWLLIENTTKPAPICSIHLYKDAFCEERQISNAEAKAVQYWPGGNTSKTLRMKCVTGHVSSAYPITVQCSSSGKWSKTPPPCYPVNCSRPAKPANGGYVSDGFHYNSTVIYFCDNGFLLNGPSKTTCQSNMRWSHREPSCEAIKCGRPPSAQNSTIAGQFYGYGGVVTYSCKKGYCWKGDMTLRCGNKGKWQGVVPRCKRLQCDPVATPAHGTALAKGPYVGMSVLFSCDPGYDLRGSKKATCQMFDRKQCRVKWSSDPPRCVGTDCVSLKNIKRGHINVIEGSGRQYPSVVKYSCDSGFKIATGTEIRTCGKNGRWSGIEPYCARILCEKPLQPLHGKFQGQSFSFSSFVKFHCHRGYRLIGQMKLTCTNKGKWNHDYPRCTATQCLPITSLLNGEVTSTGRHVGAVARITCNRGHNIQGDRRLDCVQPLNGPGRWNKPLPSCKPKMCPRLHAPINGYVRGNQLTYSSTLNFACRYGYDLKRGDSMRTCTEYGIWSGTSAVCRRIECRRPVAPIYGSVAKGPFFYRQRAEFWCKDHYALVGQHRSVCLISGNWSSSPPLCTEVRCSVPADPVNGRVIASTTAVHGTASYICERGNTLVGSPQLTCQKISNYSSIGVWSGNPPFCEPTACTVLPDPLHGQVFAQHFHYPHSVRYKCYPGYEIVSGDKVRNCTEKGLWTGNPVRCEDSCKRAGKTCIAGQKCAAATDGKVQCLCKNDTDCPISYSPVCGSDGKTYPNSCVLRATACRLKVVESLTEVSKGDCVFSCLQCSSNAHCVNNTKCLCHVGFIGDGSVCCSQAMDSQVTIEGAAAVFSCQSGCRIEALSVAWYRDKNRLVSKAPVVTIVDQSNLLILHQVAKNMSGIYTCEMSVDQAIYKRTGVLEVLDVSGGDLGEDKCGTDCGITCARKPLVARGTSTSPGEFPWQAMLCLPKIGQYCGGVLIAKDCVVTAAHCLVGERIERDNVTVCLGKHCGNCSDPDKDGRPQCLKPSSIAIHPSYDGNILNNDVAVIRLNPGVRCHCSSVMPVCLPDATRDAEYIRAQSGGVVTGWGRVNATFSRSACLKKGQVRLASRRVCRLRHEKYPVTDSMRCASDYNGACEGDSGGPLVIQNPKYGGRFVLAGVVSWGSGCGVSKTLGVYTDVLHHLSWIQSQCSV